ncbi:MAG: alpha/beta fold hydrolase [Verrucomicrobia bacterium]|nr:alpha/beta fold hydrolase [Cytophagales bacterium]
MNFQAFLDFVSANIVTIVIVYVAVCVVAYFIQERFIFKPEKLPQNFVYKYDDPFEELWFEPETGVKINGLHFTLKNAKGLLIYFHGNTRSIKGWAKYVRDFTVHGYEVVLIDYRGFGKSTGKRTEANLYKDAQFVYDSFRQKYEENQLVVYGRSLGSGFAAKLASENQPKMLILDAPYYSFKRLTKRFLPFLPIGYLLRFSIRTDIWVKYVRCPIYIIHGTKDWLIPFRSSVELASEAPLNTRLVPIYGGGHNNLSTFAEYHKNLGDILDGRYDLIFDKF